MPAKLLLPAWNDSGRPPGRPLGNLLWSHRQCHLLWRGPQGELLPSSKSQSTGVSSVLVSSNSCFKFSHRDITSRSFFLFLWEGRARSHSNSTIMCVYSCVLLRVHTRACACVCMCVHMCASMNVRACVRARMCDFKQSRVFWYVAKASLLLSIYTIVQFYSDSNSFQF